MAAAPGVPENWLRALALPHAIPFEVRKNIRTLEFRGPDPAWKAFLSGIHGSPPRSITAWAVGDPTYPLGSILIFSDEAVLLNADFVDQASRLAQIAIEHSRIYDNL